MPKEWKDKIKESDVILLQRNIPDLFNLEVAKYAKQLSKTVILDMGEGEDPFIQYRENEIIESRVSE